MPFRGRHDVCEPQYANFVVGAALIDLDGCKFCGRAGVTLLISKCGFRVKQHIWCMRAPVRRRLCEYQIADFVHAMQHNKEKKKETRKGQQGDERTWQAKKPDSYIKERTYSILQGHTVG